MGAMSTVCPHPGRDAPLTWPVKDGGRDAIGLLRIGPKSDAVGLDFALEAKRYAPTSAVGVADLLA